MSGHGDSGHGELGHILPYKIYVNVLVVLLIATVITVVVAKAPMFNFGALNIVIAMLIASAKALTVALFFMHLKYENPVTWGYAGFPLVLLALLLAGVFIDNPFRLSEPVPHIQTPIVITTESHH